ncbi:MAG: LemA family protein [Bdellovibrionales bacterium]|nr:LemA family protein [Bdellovibrionales bacterium]
MILWILLGIAAVVVIWVIATYNGLIQLRVLTENSWSDIDVNLKKRHDLIPNLVNTVKGYAGHEQATLEKVIQARNQAVQAPNQESQMEAESALSQLIPKIFALAEAYPDLKANTQFLDLQTQLSALEGEIASARRYFNAVVRDFNTKQQLFPASLIAGMFGFTTKKFFEVEEAAKATPQVSF